MHSPHTFAFLKCVAPSIMNVSEAAKLWNMCCSTSMVVLALSVGLNLNVYMCWEYMLRKMPSVLKLPFPVGSER